jgi:hypothetical protein
MTTIAGKAPFVGVRKDVDLGDLKPTEAADALNCYLQAGTIRKRPGWIEKANLTSSGGITGIYDYLKQNGASPQGIQEIALVAAGTDLYSMEAWTIGTPIYTSLGGTELVDFCTVNNRVYFCDATVFQVTDGTSIYTAAIAVPTHVDWATSGAAASSSTGELNGDYTYKVTYYSSTWGQESNASVESNIVSPASDTVDLTLPGASGDGRVDKLRIYRCKISTYESEWSFVAEVAHDLASYTDTFADAQRDALVVAPLSYTDALPALRYLEYQSDILFGAGADSYPTRLYYSRAGYPWTFDNYLEIGSAHDTDRITGLAAFHGVLVCFKERSIWTVTGTSIDTFSVTKVKPGIGCRSHFSIVDIGNYLLFLSEDGFYTFDGSDAQRISGLDKADPIRPDMVPRNYARDRFVTGVYDPALGVVLWSYSSSSATANDSIYCLNLENMRRVQYPSWTRWDLGEVSCFGALTDSTTKERKLTYGFGDGTVGQVYGTSDDGAAIDFSWKTGILDAGAPFRVKKWGECAVEVTKQTSPSDLTLNAYLDGSATATAITTWDQMQTVERTRIRHAAQALQLEFTQNSTTDTEIGSYAVDAFEGGRA